MSFAAQLAARAEATTKRTSSSGGGSSIGSPPQSQSISPSISESIKNRVSASTTEQSHNISKQQPSTTSGWKPKQQNQNKQKKKKNKKKLVPISPEASPIIDSSYRDVEIRHINNKQHQPQDVTINSNNSIPATTAKSSISPTATEESKRMSFGSAIKAHNKISSSSRENSKEDDDESVKQSQSISISQAEQSNSTTAYTKKDSSSSSEQRLSSTTQALDTQLDLSIENLQLQSSLHDIQTKYKQLELQLNEKKKDDKGITTTTQTQNQNQNNLVYTRKSSDAMSSIGGASGWINAIPTTKTGREGELQLQRETSGISVDVESFVTHDELMEENVRLTQLILDSETYRT